MSYYLPAKLNPQGWLNDMVLPKIYNPKSRPDGEAGMLQDALYFENFPGIANKIVSLHPEYRNIFIQSMQKVSNTAGKNSKDLTINQDYVDFMMNLQPKHIAAMQPYIRIYLKTKMGGKKSSWVYSNTKDIIFRPFTDIDLLTQKNTKCILQNKFMRGSEAGIESVSVMRDFPAWGMGASFYVDINYVFSSFQVFAQGHPNQSGDGSLNPKKDDYLLLLKPDMDNNQQVLVLEYGWSIKNKGDKSLWGDVGKDILNIVEEQEKKTFRITWYKHDIEYSETGEVKLKVKYMGIPERMAFKNPKIKEETDILKPMSLRILKSITKDPDMVEHYENLERVKKEVRKLDELCLEAETPEKQQELKLQKKEKQENIKKASVMLEKLKREMARKAGTLYLTQILKRGKLFQVKFRSSKKEFDKNVKYDKKRHTLETYFFKVTERDFKKPKTLDGPAFEPLDETLVDIFADTYGVNKSLSDSAKRVKPTKPKTKAEDFVLEQLDKILGALTYSNFGADKSRVISSKQQCPKGFGVPKGEEGKAGKGKKRCLPTKVSDRGEKRHGAETYGNFMFFPLRELIATLHEFSKSDDEDSGFNKYPVTSLGNVVYRPMGKDLVVNIGDILIETDLFLKWFYKTVTTREASTITFGQFLSLIMEELVPLVLGHGVSDLSSGLVSDIVHTPFGVSTKLAHPSRRTDKRLDNLYLKTPKQPPAWIEYSSPEVKPELPPHQYGWDLLQEYQVEAKSNKDKNNDQPIIHFHQRVTDATAMSNTGFNAPQLKQTEGRNFNRKKDQEDGMFHVFIGNSRGLMETISFSYTDNQHLRTALVFDKFKDIAFPYLKFAYSASPILTGNNLFYKGGYFVLPSAPLGIQPEDDPGITGYYQISKLNDQLTMGTYKTSIQGMNIHSPANQKKEIAFQKKQEACGIINKKEELPKLIPIFLDVDIDQYIHSDFLKNPNYAKIYGLTVKSKKELKADAGGQTPVVNKITLKPGEVLKKNSKGENVDKLQQKLIEKKYLKPEDISSCKPKCPYGPKTEAAVKAYQKDNNLKVDGKAGEKTLSKLQAAPEPKIKTAKNTTKADLYALRKK